jgi:hypothetical protein
MSDAKAKRLASSHRKYMEAIEAAGRPVSFSEIIAVTPGLNTFRGLKDHGYVRDVSVSYRTGEPYTGPRPPAYVLTEKGRAVLAEARREPSR